MKNKTLHISFLLLLVFTIHSCDTVEDVLDKRDLSALTSLDVWNDNNLATLYGNNLYLDLPGWNPVFSSYSDESGYGNGLVYGFGIILDENPIGYWQYGAIRKINILFDEIDGGSLSEEVKNLLKGQSYFLRAFHYFEMLRRYGGVPIITQPQGLEDDLFVERNTSLECFDFIMSDLDQAILLLPDNWGSADIGRANKGAAHALKGRVALYKASPQFNRSNDAQYWQEAYALNKTALEYLINQNYELMSVYGDIWLNEMNDEVIFAKRYQFPNLTHNRDASIRPVSESYLNLGYSHPTLELVNAYPMKNGLPITDPASGYSETEFWENRDNRFNETIVYNGSVYPVSGKAGRIQWTYSGHIDGLGASQNGTDTGFLTKKGSDVSLDVGAVNSSGVDWVELRLGEVMLNFAETANEVGNQNESYEMLSALRERAGIEPGPEMMYGIPAGLNGTAMREAILNERFIELAFEQHRFWDLRRWMILDRLNGTTRHGLIPYAIDENDLSKGFTYEERELDIQQLIEFPENYYFFPVPRVQIQNNPNLVQTSGWEDGTFDSHF